MRSRLKTKQENIIKELPREQESKRLSGYLVEVAVSHQLMLVLQSVLEQGPYDGLQFRVGGQQVGAEYLQPRVGQAVHYSKRKPQRQLDMEKET